MGLNGYRLGGNILIKRLRCGSCRKLVKYNDQVYLDIMNTVIHQRCYTPSFEFKDKNKLWIIIKK